MKTILASVCLALSLLLPAQATGYDILLPWLAPQGLGFTLGKAILDFAEDKKRSELDMLVLDKTRSLPADIANAFNKITTPIAASFLAYSRLHNKTVDENNFFSKGIAWSYLVIRLHQADEGNNQTGYVTGWYAGANGSDYRTYGAFESVSRAFIGRWERSGKDGPMELQWRRVDRKGEGKIHDSEGYEHFIRGKADPDNATICGDWEAYSEKLKIQGMEHQKGTMRIILGRLNPEDYSFDMNKVKRSREWNDEKVRKSINDFNNIASILGTKYFPYFFTHEEQEQLVAYCVDKAWEAYQEYLPEDLKKKKEDITNNFTVHLKEIVTSDTQNSPVPARFSKLFHDPEKPREWGLDISYNLFRKFDIDTAISKIAHEFIGHGVIHRYYVYIPMSFAEPYLRAHADGKTNISPAVLDRRPAVSSEGFATCVEYNVLKKLYDKKCMRLPYPDLEAFSKDVYKKDTQKYYTPGIHFLKNQNYIKNDKIDWDELERNLESAKTITEELIKERIINWNDDSSDS